MSKWIDTDKLIDDLDRYCKPKLSDYDMTNPEHLTIQEIKYYSESRMYDEILEKIQGSDSVDVAPVELAHWIQANDIDETAWRCSKCDLTWILNEGTPSQNEMRYCPKCGAYMIESEGRE